MHEKADRAERILIAVVSFFAVTGVVGVTFLQSPTASMRLVESPTEPFPGVEAPLDAIRWFGSVRQHCNPVEVETYLGWQPAPPTPDGDMYKAACFALAGRIDRARGVIDSLPPGLRRPAAGIVFEAGHPAADAGDDVAAGPLMELVLEYWPGHYMALYHAGAARFDLGDYDVAEGYLKRFLAAYGADDGWTASATAMLAAID